MVLSVQAVDRLGRDLPVNVDGEQWEEAGEALDDIFIGDAEVWWCPACQCFSTA
jgi:hypothetical protein